ncbi:hypothetical protein [Flagellimonas yonaguniensis]|nr:hypothetical protein [[Muricauda] yonaguniensis]
MESSQGYGVDLKKTKQGRRTFYRYTDSDYSINNQPINELEAEQLKSAMMVLSRFKGLPQFEWINELLETPDIVYHPRRVKVTIAGRTKVTHPRRAKVTHL